MKYVLKKRYIGVIIFLFPFVMLAQDKKGFNNAFSAYEDGDYEKALQLFNAIESSNSDNAEFFLFRGICFSETGNDVKAITDYNSAIEIDPKYSEAYNQRGFSFFSQGNNELAIKDFDQAIKLNPDMAETYMNRGSAKYDDRDLEGACKDWKTAKAKGIGVAGQLVEQLCK